MLRLIFERLDSQVSLIRAPSTCKQWHRVIADPIFLRRYRSLHAPTIAGDYLDYSPWPPHHLAELGREASSRARCRRSFIPRPLPSMIEARHYALDFLPNPMQTWTIMDSRGSLLLMCRTGTPFLGHGGMIACEPLSRRYVTIPDLPPDMDLCNAFYFPWGAFLVDGDDTDETGGCIGMSNFMVLCKLHSDENYVVHAAIFTAATTRDSSSSWSWSKKVIGDISPAPHSLRRLGRSAGSWCFYDEGDHKLLVLDGGTGEFSSPVFPLAIESLNSLDHGPNRIYVSDYCHDGRQRVCTLFLNAVEVLRSVDDNGGLAVETRAQLSEIIRDQLPGHKERALFFRESQSMETFGPGFVVLKPLPPPAQEKWYFFFDDLETRTVRTPVADDTGLVSYPYELPWPPRLKTFV
ncbi:hypothetical protein BS78_08G118700 [Paspalum vaginatum]|nr:hypothetical protein BS78_08G118700 [Paspalum vaginatum]